MRTGWRNFKALGATRRRAVVAVPLVGLAYAVTGSTGTLTVAAVSASVLLMLLHSQPSPNWEPSPEQLRAIDAHRAAEDADMFATSGVGDAAYEEALLTLQGLVGQEVTVSLGSGGAAWMPLGLLSGILRHATDVSADAACECLFSPSATGAAGSSSTPTSSRKPTPSFIRTAVAAASRSAPVPAFCGSTSGPLTGACSRAHQMA